MKRETQIKICKIIGIPVAIIVVIFLVIVIFVPNPQKQENKQASQAKQEQLSQQKKEAQEKKEEEAKKPPIVSFKGVIDPTTANVGSKVVIRVDIQNTSSTKTIKGAHLYFGNKKFIKEGLNVVNVMSGGVQYGNTFIWGKIEIPPKQTISFNIVCEAVTVGTYNTDILLEDVNGYELADKDGNSELNGQIIITP